MLVYLNQYAEKLDAHPQVTHPLPLAQAWPLRKPEVAMARLHGNRSVILAPPPTHLEDRKQLPSWRLSCFSRYCGLSFPARR